MKNKKKKTHTVLMEGPISPIFISDSIAKHSSKTSIGAHTLFLGQVRQDEVGGKEVSEIEYTAHSILAEMEFQAIREEAFSRFELTCIHMHHSIGTVKVGEICLFVFVSAVRREAVFEACSFLVEEIKKRVPIWGKEIFSDGTSQWKINTSKTEQQHG